jgi:GTP-binding protein HflX
MVPLSATTGEGCDDFLRVLDAHLAEGIQTVRVRLHPEEGQLLAWLYAHGDVVKRSDRPEAIALTVRLSPQHAGRLARRLGVRAAERKRSGDTTVTAGG